MSNLLKSMIRFSWTMPIFGMRQMGNILAQPESAARAFDSVTDAVQSELDHSTSTIFKSRVTTQQPVMETIFDIRSGQRPTGAPTRSNETGLDRSSEVRAEGVLFEETIVTTSHGTATVRHGIDGRAYFIVHGQLESGNGTPEGEFDGVWAARVFTPQDLVSYPEKPLPPFERPFKPGEEGWNPQLNFTKARWIFPRGWLEAVGPALSRIHIHKDGQTQFWYAVAAFVTGGGGVYEGVRGTATSTGSARFPAPPQPAEALSFELNAVHVLKVVRTR